MNAKVEEMYNDEEGDSDEDYDDEDVGSELEDTLDVNDINREVGFDADKSMGEGRPRRHSVAGGDEDDSDSRDEGDESDAGPTSGANDGLDGTNKDGISGTNEDKSQPSGAAGVNRESTEEKTTTMR
jgi:hypothetical protein